MSEFIRCPSCGLIVSTRRSARCPRCARPVPGSTAPDVAPAATAAPAVARSKPAVAVRAPAAAGPAAARPAAPAAPRVTFAGGLASAAGAAIGVAASKVFGVALLFPAVFGTIAAVILAKAGPRRARPFVPAVSVLAGHAGWMASGALLAGTLAPVALDLALMIAGAAWLVARPGLAPAAALAVLELLAGAVNGWQLSNAAVGGARLALALHLVLRAAAVAALAFGYARHRGDRATAARTALAQTFE